MKAYVLDRSGGPEILEVCDVPEPEVGAGQVRVALRHVGVNWAEIMSRKGLYGWAPRRPYILGMEGAGVIEEVGSGVDPSRQGESVMVGAQSGSYAEKMVVPQEQALPAFDSYTTAENAAFLVNYLTAWVSLMTLARLRRDETVLVTAAAGGVGSAAVQLASRLGARVYGLCGSREKVELVKSLGAVDSFDYRDRAVYPEIRKMTGGVDVVLELVGGEAFRQSFVLLKPFGRIAIAGFSSMRLQKWNPLSWWRLRRDLPRVDMRALLTRSLSVMSTHLGYVLGDRPRIRELHDELRSFVIEHQIRPVVGKVFPFAAAADAHRFLESRQSTGKVVLAL